MHQRSPSQDETLLFIQQLSSGINNPTQVVELARSCINRTSLENYYRSIAKLAYARTYLSLEGYPAEASQVATLEIDLQSERNIVDRINRGDIQYWGQIGDLIWELPKYPLIPNSVKLNFIKFLSRTYFGRVGTIRLDLEYVLENIKNEDKQTYITLLLYALCHGNNLNELVNSNAHDILNPLNAALNEASDIQLSSELKSVLLKQLMLFEFPHHYPNVEALIERVVLERINLLLQQNPTVTTLTEVIHLATLHVNIPEALAERILQLAVDLPFDCQTLGANPFARIGKLFDKISDPNKKARFLVYALTQNNLLSSLCSQTMPVMLLHCLIHKHDIHLDLQTKMAFMQSKNGAKLIKSERVLQELIGSSNLDHELLRVTLFRIKELQGEEGTRHMNRVAADQMVQRELRDAVKQAKLLQDVPTDISNTLLSLLAFSNPINLDKTDLTNLIDKIEDKSFKTVILLRALTPGNALAHLMPQLCDSNILSFGMFPLTYREVLLNKLKSLKGTSLTMDKYTHQAIADVFADTALVKAMDKEVYAWLDKSSKQYKSDVHSYTMGIDNL